MWRDAFHLISEADRKPTISDVIKAIIDQVVLSQGFAQQQMMADS
jgi:hypothetical protein